MRNALKNAKVVGFFSMPSSSLAEHNPTAYNNAMAMMPRGAGSCSHCGTGILHHVVIQDPDGTTRFIGTQCAERVGVSPESLRYRLTSDQLAERKAKREAAAELYQAQRQAEEDALRERIATRREHVGHLVDMLRRLSDARERQPWDSDFYGSLANQLEQRPLSDRQAHFVAKATSATGRRNKKNADAWDEVLELCTTDTKDLGK